MDRIDVDHFARSPEFSSEEPLGRAAPNGDRRAPRHLPARARANAERLERGTRAAQRFRGGPRPRLFHRRRIALDLLDPLITEDAIVIGHRSGAVLAMQVIGAAARRYRRWCSRELSSRPPATGEARRRRFWTTELIASRSPAMRSATDPNGESAGPVRPLSTLVRLAVSPGETRAGA